MVRVRMLSLEDFIDLVVGDTESRGNGALRAPRMASAVVERAQPCETGRTAKTRSPDPRPEAPHHV